MINGDSIILRNMNLMSINNSNKINCENISKNMIQNYSNLLDLFELFVIYNNNIGKIAVKISLKSDNDLFSLKNSKSK